MHDRMKRWWAAAALIVICHPAQAHEWFNGTHDPTTGNICCGGNDCQVLPDEAVRAVPGGYVIQFIPKGFPGEGTISTPFTIPNQRAQPGKDPAHYALCIWGREYHCFFTPWPAY